MYPGVRTEVAKWAEKWVGDYGHLGPEPRYGKLQKSCQPYLRHPICFMSSQTYLLWQGKKVVVLLKLGDIKLVVSVDVLQIC